MTRKIGNTLFKGENVASSGRKIKISEIAIVALLAIVLYTSWNYRTKRLLESPGWFRDEGSYIEMARQLGKARLKMGAVNITFVGPNMTHPPLYFAALNLFFKLGKPDMYHFRLFNALLGVISTLLIFVLGCEAGTKDSQKDAPPLSALVLGLLGAFFFAIHPDAVLYNRMGLPYNLYQLEALVVAFFSLRYLRTREFFWCLGACIVASASLLTVYYSVVFIPFLFLVILLQKKSRHLWALGCVPIPLIIFMAYMAHNAPGFWEDIRALRSAAGTGSLYVTLYHYHDFFHTGLSYFLGFIGLLFIRRKKAGVFLFLLYLFMIHIVLRRKDTIIRFIHYPVIPILPFVALGIAALTLFLLYRLKSLSPVALFLIPVVLGSYLSINQVRHGIWGRFPTPLEFGMTKNTQDNFAVGKFLKANTEPTDLVITTSVLWSLIDTRTANIPQSQAYEGKKVEFYMHPFPRERFLFPPALKNARFVVLDSFTDLWKDKPADPIHGPLCEAVLKIEKNWEPVYTRGEYRVYQNPVQKQAKKPEEEN